MNSTEPSDWAKALEWHVANMKAREQEQARLCDEHRTKYEQIMRERMELENTIDKAKAKTEH